MPLGAPELLIVLVLVLVVFGGAKLPQLARSLGSARREFERGHTEQPTPSSSNGVLPSGTTAGHPSDAA